MFPVAELLVVVANPDSCWKILENLHDFGYFSGTHESNEEAIETYCYYIYIARDWAIATNIFRVGRFDIKITNKGNSRQEIHQIKVHPTIF